MARFCGKIGFVKTIETSSPGVYRDSDPIERTYYGTVTKDNRRWEHGTGLNDNLTINNAFSIVADSYALDNLYAMKYLIYQGVKWKITSIDIERPRLTLCIGGIYNG